MKNLAILFILLLTSFSTYAKHDETLTIKTNIHCKRCLQCGTCGESITTQLKAQQGVKEVLIDPKANTISVTYNVHQTTAEQIRHAVNKAGYDADDKKASAEQVKQLGKCCRKK